MCSCVQWTASALTEKESKGGDDSEAVRFWFCGVKCSLRATAGNSDDKYGRCSHELRAAVQEHTQEFRQWKLSVVRYPHLLLQSRYLFVTLPFVPLCLPSNKF
jgi:hypothetical protein